MHDSIVPHWVPLQWVAKRRHLLHALHSDNNGHDSKPLLCRVNMKGGHFGYDVEIPFQKVSRTEFNAKWMHDNNANG